MDSLVQSGRLSQAQMDKYNDAENVVLYMEILCQLKSDIFKSLGDQEQCCDWMKIVINIYNFFFKEDSSPFTMQSKLKILN